jgi:type IV pilus assembly protein PilY1
VKDSLNPNGNASCTDVFLVDADGGFVGEDDGGGFVLLDTNQAFAADGGGWPQKSPKTAANPVWEAAALLTSREIGAIQGSGGTVRNILTVNMDGGIPAVGSALITYNDLSSANVTRMTDYMKLSGQNSDFCTGMAQVSRHTYASEQDCGKDLMKFIDGYDVERQNTDGGLARPNILGDIFHSSPILISPPVPPSFCDLGIINQCVPTLYKQQSATGATPNGATAYNSYLSTNANRQELLVVGANDGMLHAFQAGTETTAATFDINNNQISAATYDDGTGAETWAFIPADMLPKLQRYALSQSHNILVDGAPWVRDIWSDGSGTTNTTADRQKQSDEFHTILVIGERTGGRHYTALDVTDTANNPKFLWTWRRARAGTTPRRRRRPSGRC